MNKTPLIIITWALAVFLAFLVIADLFGVGLFSHLDKGGNNEFMGIFRYTSFIIFGVLAIFTLIAYWFRDNKRL